MKTRGVQRVVMVLFIVVAAGCQEARQVNPTVVSLFIPRVEGVWNGPLTLAGTSGGECVTGPVIPTFLPTQDFGTFTLSQDANELAATLTMEATGLACRYAGTATTSTVALNATSCDRTGLAVQCVDGTARELELVGSSVTASWGGNQISGRTTSTYNVLIPKDHVKVGSLVATHDFTATRR